MSEIKRYNIVLDKHVDGSVESCSSGQVVFYEDHQKTIESKSRVIDKQKEAIRVQKSQIEAQAKEIERLKKVLRDIEIRVDFSDEPDYLDYIKELIK